VKNEIGLGRVSDSDELRSPLVPQRLALT